jgi:hypothetical protein
VVGWEEGSQKIEKEGEAQQELGHLAKTQGLLIHKDSIYLGSISAVSFFFIYPGDVTPGTHRFSLICGV